MIVKLSRHGSSKAVVLPKSVLELIKANEHTEFELSTDGRRLNLDPIDGRKKLIDEATDQVISERFEVLKSLASK